MGLPKRLLACGCGGGLPLLHGCLCCLGLEEQREGLTEEILGIHPSVAELVAGKLLDRADTFLVEELHIVAGIAVKEIIGAYAKPEQMDLAVGVGSMVIDLRQIRRGE